MRQEVLPAVRFDALVIRQLVVILPSREWPHEAPGDPFESVVRSTFPPEGDYPPSVTLCPRLLTQLD